MLDFVEIGHEFSEKGPQMFRCVHVLNKDFALRVEIHNMTTHLWDGVSSNLLQK
jgi:hypothetical protein